MSIEKIGIKFAEPNASRFSTIPRLSVKGAVSLLFGEDS